MKPGDTVATVDAHLAPNIQQVAGVQVQATRPRPPRSLGNDGGLGTDPTNKTVDGVANALSPELQGNLDAMAGMIPGFNTIAGGGFSAFGLGGDANMKTLNGMNFSGDALPRDVATSTKYMSSPWDPTRGGFSGALASTSVSRGEQHHPGERHATLDAPALQVTDPIAARFGQKYTNLQVGGARSGALLLDKYFYNFGGSATMNRAPVSSLLDLDSDALAHAGISPDSAVRLTQLLGGPGHPAHASAAFPISARRSPATSSDASTTRCPIRRRDARPRRSSTPSSSATIPRRARASLSPTSLPANTGKISNGGGQVQGMYSRYFGARGDYVNETSAGVSLNESRGEPYLVAAEWERADRVGHRRSGADDRIARLRRQQPARARQSRASRSRRTTRRRSSSTTISRCRRCCTSNRATSTSTSRSAPTGSDRSAMRRSATSPTIARAPIPERSTPPIAAAASGSAPRRWGRRTTRSRS